MKSSLVSIFTARTTRVVALFLSVSALSLGGLFINQAYAAITSVTLGTPNGGEYWSGTKDITWTQTGGVSGDNVSILLSKHGGGSFGTVIATGVDITTSPYSWDTNNTAAGPLADGSTYKIQINDGSTGLAVSSANFTVDNTAPATTYSIVPAIPAGTGWYNISTGAPTVTLSCTDTTSGCNKIDWGFDGVNTSQTNSAGDTASFAVAEGEHQIVWRATDNALNVETLQGPNSVKVDTIAPTTPSITSIAGDNLINIVEAGAVIVTGTAEANSTVSVTLSDGTNPSVTATGTADGAGAYSITLDASSLADGTITPTVNATDAAGNTSGDATTPTAIKDTIAPVTSGAPDLTAASDTGDSSTDNITSNNTPDYNIASCTSGNLVTIYVGTVANGSATCGSTGSVIVTTTPATSDGTYNVSFTETDSAGNESGKSLPLGVKIDTAAPVVPVVTGITNDTGEFTNDGITKDNTLKFTGTASLDTTNVEVFVNGTSVGNAVVTSGAWSFDDTSTTLIDGTYSVTAKASDLAGNQSAASSVFSLTVDTTKPEVLTATATPDPAKDGLVTVTVKFNENMDAIIPDVNILGITGSPITATQTSFTGDTWVGTFTLADNNENATAVISVAGAIDIAGNMMNSNASAGTFVVDTVDPNITDFDSPAVDTVYTSDPPLDFTPGDIGGVGTLSCSYSLDGGVQVPVTPCTAGIATGATETIPTLTDGRHTISVTVTDAAGNSVTSTPVSFVYDNNHILTVGATGADFTTIQGAIDAWVNGITTVQVAAGTYPENVNVDQAITLEGANAEIDPNTGTYTTESKISPTSGTAVTIASDGVTVKGFTITNNGSDGTGIYSSDNSNLTIKNNIIEGIGNSNNDKVGRGIEVISSAAAVDGVTIKNNKIDNITSGKKVSRSSGTSASGISIGWSTGSKDITNLLIQDNVISNINANTNSWGNGGYGAYGILINHGASGTGKVATPQILGNTISGLEGLWAHAIGLEGNTPNAKVTGNIISNLTGHKGNTDAFGVFFQDNPSAASVTVARNQFNGLKAEFGGVGIHSDDLPGGSNGYSYVVTAENNWWGNATGPYDGPLAGNKNPNGLGAHVTKNVDYSPFYNSSAMDTLVSVDPIASFDLNFNPTSQAVNNSATLTVTAKDVSGITVVNDTTTKMNIAGDNGSSFGSTLLTMGALGTTGTTIANTITGPVNVTATEVGGTATGAGVMTFVAGSDVTAPVISNIQVTNITTTGATITWTTDENASSQAEYGLTSSYGVSTSVGSATVTSHSVILTGLASGTVYHFRVKSIDASSNSATSGDNTFTTVGVDTTPPVITLLGQNPITLTVGDTFTDPTATANDNVDGDITTNITTGGTITNGFVTTTAGIYTVTYDVTDTAGNLAATETRTVIVVDPAVASVTPVVSLDGVAISSSYSQSDASTRFASGLVFDTTNVSSFTINGSTVTVVPADTIVTAKTMAEATTLGLHVYNVVVTSSTGDTANVTVAYTVTADFNDTASLGITGIDAVKTYAANDGTFANGWQWTFHVTAPTGEKYLRMKFSDFTGTNGSIPVATNLRFYSTQATTASDSAHAITINGADAYSADMLLDTDLSPTTPGRQIDITVEMRVPTTATVGSYSTSYGIDTSATSN